MFLTREIWECITSANTSCTKMSGPR